MRGRGRERGGEKERERERGEGERERETLRNTFKQKHIEFSFSLNTLFCCCVTNEQDSQRLKVYTGNSWSPALWLPVSLRPRPVLLRAWSVPRGGSPLSRGRDGTGPPGTLRPPAAAEASPPARPRPPLPKSASHKKYHAGIKYAVPSRADTAVSHEHKPTTL